MRHIHTSIISRQNTRGNKKILRTTPPHISSSEEGLLARLIAPLPNSEQINRLFLKSYLYKVVPNHFHHHYSPQTPHTHIISSTAPICAPHCHPLICEQTRRRVGIADQMDGEASWWPTSGKIGLPPSKGQGCGWTIMKKREI